MILKLKAKIYQYTGIYLARKEEAAYMDKVTSTKKSERSVYVGLWQANNGFQSFRSKYRNKAVLKKLSGNIFKSMYYKVLDRIVIIWMQFKQDMGL